MKSTFFILALACVVLAVSIPPSSGDCSAEQVFRCFTDCKINGHHGLCEWGSCVCTSCYYRACKVKCARQGRIAQCQEDQCVCLG